MNASLAHLIIAGAGAGLCGLIGMWLVHRAPETAGCTCPKPWPGAAPLRICAVCVARHGGR